MFIKSLSFFILQFISRSKRLIFRSIQIGVCEENEKITKQAVNFIYKFFSYVWIFSNFFLQLNQIDKEFIINKMRPQKQGVLLAILIVILVAETQQAFYRKQPIYQPPPRPPPPPPPPPSPPVDNDPNWFRLEDRFDRLENRQGRKDWQQVVGRIGNWKVNLGQFGFGSNYNSRWDRNLILLELDSNANQVYEYRFYLEGGLYELSFQWAAREGSPLQTSQLAVNFNGVEIRHLNPPNYDIQFFRSHVYARYGYNFLELIGRGSFDSYGASVGVFSLIKT